MLVALCSGMPYHLQENSILFRMRQGTEPSNRILQGVWKRYGQENVVINMHLACHLKECIIDYGPVHEFWCFGFERFNGILGSYPNNHQNNIHNNDEKI